MFRRNILRPTVATETWRLLLEGYQEVSLVGFLWRGSPGDVCGAHCPS
jgi:hypothetical protein